MLKRIAVSLISGYILLYYGEFVFWATPDREDFDLLVALGMWLLYSCMAYPFLCVVSLFNARNPWAIFLAGAFYGWFEEGLVVQTMYGTPDGPFPMSISFTGLAWHAAIGVWVGWYLVRKILIENNYLKTLALGLGIGLFYGLWAIWWWNEPPSPMKELLESGRKDVLFIHFFIFAYGTTALLILAHWLYQRINLTEFKPSKVEIGICGGLALLYFALVSVPAAPKAIWVLPPLLGLTFWALSNNKGLEKRQNATTAFSHPVTALNRLLLFSIPTTASTIYFLALATDFRLPTNIIFYYTATPLAALAWILSVGISFKKYRTVISSEKTP
jgi:hypothetical protein